MAQNKLNSEHLISGLFFNDNSQEKIHYRRFFVDDDKIYCEDG